VIAVIRKIQFVAPAVIVQDEGLIDDIRDNPNGIRVTTHDPTNAIFSLRGASTRTMAKQKAESNALKIRMRKTLISGFDETNTCIAL
jgi:hypothetical protein